jgi:hypothetical protein
MQPDDPVFGKRPDYEVIEFRGLLGDEVMLFSLGREATPATSSVSSSIRPRGSDGE